MVEIDVLKELIKDSIERFYKSNDKELIKRNLAERSLAFRFGLHLKSVLSEGKKYKEYKSLDLDCEYNKNFEKIKGLQGFSVTHGVYPDFILHKRKSNDNNKIVIEIKKETNKKVTAREKDKEKLIGFTKPTQPGKGYNYKLGAFIDLHNDAKDTIENIVYFTQGKEEVKKTTKSSPKVRK
jgi:hypothetical protein